MEGDLKPLWKRPGIVVLVAVVVLANFIADVWLFKPENIATFVITDAVIIGVIVVVAIRRQPPDGGSGNAY